MPADRPADLDLSRTTFDAVDARRAAVLLEQLRLEMPTGHALYPWRETFRVLAETGASDDVVVATGDAAAPLALIHLTWRQGSEPYPEFPTFEPFVDADELRAYFLGWFAHD